MTGPVNRIGCPYCLHRFADAEALRRHLMTKRRTSAAHGRATRDAMQQHYEAAKRAQIAIARAEGTERLPDLQDKRFHS